MSLRFPQLLTQVEGLSDNAARRAADAARKLPVAMKAIEEAKRIGPDELEARIRRAGDRWRGAHLSDEPVDQVFDVPAHPPRLNVIGADGSQIHPDRHAAALYFLINIGSILVEQGTGKPPSTASEAAVFYEDDDLYDETGELASPAWINGKRDVAEMATLARLAESSAGEPALCILDNGLLLWLALQAGDQHRKAIDRLLADYLTQLTHIRESGAAVAGFVDRPRSADVLALLALVLAPEAGGGAIVQGNPYRGLTDRSLFAGRLEPGQRSARFVDSSPVNRDFETAGHQVQFFYLNTGGHDAIARVEIPKWVAEDPHKMAWVHAGIIEQCRTTGGFPYPLVRAHELAVVTAADRNAFESMIEGALLRRGLRPRRSQKAQTKRWTGSRRRHRL
jgi:hypothetical protein